MRVKPFSYLEQKDVGVTPPSAGIPQESNILFRYEDPATNVTGSVWNDTSGVGYTTATLFNTSGDLTSGSVQLDNSNGRVYLTTNTNIDIKSVVLLYNIWEPHYSTFANRSYFWDMRKSGNSNGGYFNQYDSVSTNSTHLFGNDGEYYSYDETDGTVTGPQLTTPANLTAGLQNNTGGSATYQWLGPNERNPYYPKRMWHFNFNSNTPIGLISTISTNTGKVYFGTNDNGSEGSPFGYFSIIGWSVALTSTEVDELVAYYKAQGVLT